MSLNNLTLLYNQINQIKKSKEIYMEALKIYKELAKNNFQAYGIKLANSLVMGVDLLNQPIRDLYEAEEILKEFRGVQRLKDY